MSTDELYAVVNPWYETGSLPESQKPAVQQLYTELTGDPGERCRTCPSYWSDVLHTLRVHLKQLGYQSMDNSHQEYIIRPDAGYLQVHGLPHVYINKGSGKESDSAKYLTDDIAKNLLKENPARSEVIIKNPDYKAASETAKKSTATTAPKPKPVKKAEVKTVVDNALLAAKDSSLSGEERIKLLADANEAETNQDPETGTSQEPPVNS